jgi:uncharacterized protein
MSDAVLEALIKQVMENSGRNVSIGWQGGEPTLMGLDFFKKAVAFEKQYGRPGQNVGNGLQTNGTLLDEEWADFLREYNFLIGLSLDGPAHVHDRYRVTEAGRPTYERVVETAHMLRRKQVEANILTVVNDYSVRFPEEIYDHHKNLGYTHFQFIPCVETDPNDPTRAAAWSVTPEAYGEFLCRIFDKWTADFRNDAPTTSVRWFDSVFHTYVGLCPPECTLLQECGVYVVCEHNGDIFSCDFYVEDPWRLGNVLTGDMLDMLNSERQRKFGAIKAALPPECPTCPYLAHCNGGCPKDRQRNPETNGSNQFCKSYLAFFGHAHARMTQLAERWKRQQADAMREMQRQSLRRR